MEWDEAAGRTIEFMLGARGDLFVLIQFPVEPRVMFGRPLY